MFASVVLITDPTVHLRSGFRCVCESWRRTRKKFWTILLVLFPFGAIVWAVSSLLDGMSGTYESTFLIDLLSGRMNDATIILFVISMILIGNIMDIIWISLGMRVLGIGADTIRTTRSLDEIIKEENKTVSEEKPVHD